MAQPLEMQDIEMKDNTNMNNIDTTRVYVTSGIIKRVGGAIALSLSDATLPGNSNNKHMTILYRKSPKWTESEIELISRECDLWLKQKYGNNKAPITFTISKWGNQSAKINGDLFQLCVYLRNKFMQLSNDKQRIPHVELFKRQRRNKFNGKKDKICHICGGSGHFKKHCPQKQNYKNGKKFHKKFEQNNNNEKIKFKLQKMIAKTNSLKNIKKSEIDILNEQEIKLTNLLENCDTLDNKTLRNEIKNIAKTFKNKRKHFNKINKCNNKKNKLLNKESKKLEREKRKQLKNERKRIKNEKKEQLLKAQLMTLPLKSDINNNDILYIYVDGYNIIGCDNICRKSMRGRGMKKARMRMAELLQNKFLNCYNNGYLKLDYLPIIKLWFDGNGKNSQFNDIEITFSTKQQIVDDKLVELFSKNNKKQNSNILVITSDRELTLRLDNIGVKVMKSSVFYKTFLKEKDNENNNNNEEEKEDIIISETNDNSNENDSDGFIEIISSKINATKKSESEFEENNTDSTDYEQIEGINDEFTEIFGEYDEMDCDSDPTNQ